MSQIGQRKSCRARTSHPHGRECIHHCPNPPSWALVVKKPIRFVFVLRPIERAPRRLREMQRCCIYLSGGGEGVCSGEEGTGAGDGRWKENREGT